MRALTYAQALCEATDICLAHDPNVYVMGLGVPDPGAIFGTTKGLREKYGAERVLDMPIAENGMTGIAIGSALAGLRPIITHQRVDFMLLSMEQIVNQAAKWHYMFDGKARVPLVIRMIIGRGWGQGPQHSQSLHSCFGHIPGLKVVMPFTPADAKGMLISAVEDDNPVIFIEHRWLHNMQDSVPEGITRTPLDTARTAREGEHVTIAAVSHTTYESLRAAYLLEKIGIHAEVIDLRSVRPLDLTAILRSVKKTGRFVAVDTDWAYCGFSAELVAVVAESAFSYLKAAPIRLGWADYPVPTSPALCEYYYPTPRDIALAAVKTLGRTLTAVEDAVLHIAHTKPHDVPDLAFTGPF